MADDDDFQFDFEGKLPAVAEPGPGGRPVRLEQLGRVETPRGASQQSTSKVVGVCVQGGPGNIPPHLPSGTHVGQSLGNFKKNYRQVCFLGCFCCSK
jgi:hypothetical protein